jgi:Zn-dependent peptidase ImmA (M78 family)
MEKVTVPLFKRDDVAPLPAVVCRASQKKDPAEWQADQFAARLMMPASSVRDAVRELTGRHSFAIEDLDGRATGPGVSEKLRSLATAVIDQGHFSNVSNEAMRVRLMELQVVGRPAAAGLA